MSNFERYTLAFVPFEIFKGVYGESLKKGIKKGY